jgi:hypothetical protein
MKNGLSGAEAFLRANPGNRLLCHRFGEMPGRIVVWFLDGRYVLGERRSQLFVSPPMKPQK